MGAALTQKAPSRDTNCNKEAPEQPSEGLAWPPGSLRKGESCLPAPSGKQAIRLMWRAWERPHLGSLASDSLAV